MEASIVLKLNSDPKLHEFLMNHSYYYKELNRDPAYIDVLEKEYKKFKREQMTKKVTETVENIETITNIMSIM